MKIQLYFLPIFVSLYRNSIFPSFDISFGARYETDSNFIFSSIQLPSLPHWYKMPPYILNVHVKLGLILDPNLSVLISTINCLIHFHILYVFVLFIFQNFPTFVFLNEVRTMLKSRNSNGILTRMMFNIKVNLGKKYTSSQQKNFHLKAWKVSLLLYNLASFYLMIFI